jgi:2-(1,2-epoxy-1,2-dihydrophenyl)acetyl-CoA isomerase
MSVRLDREGPVRVVTLDRPDAGNAFTPEGASDLREAVDEALADEDGRAVLVEGAGEAFCTGADLACFEAAIEDGRASEVVARTSDTMNDVLAALLRSDTPVVACVDGAAAGGGLGLALACDLRVLSEDATLTPGFLSVGVSPDGATTWLLPRMTGAARAREILLRDETLDAEAARAEGLATGIAPAGEAREAALELARELASRPAAALAGTKRRLLEPQADLVEHLEAERDATAASAETAAFREGVRAFRAGRAPSFPPDEG